MKFGITSAKLTANPDEGGWSQAYDFTPSDEDKLRDKGSLYAVISTKSSAEGLESVMAGRELLARLHEEYFGNNSVGGLQLLKASVGKVLQEFSDWEGVEIGVLVYKKDVMYFAAGNGAKVQLFRNGQLHHLLQSDPGKVVSLSGYPKEEDVYMIATSMFFEKVAEGVVKPALSSKDPKEAAEILATQIHSQENCGNTGVVILSYDKTAEEVPDLVINDTLKEMAKIDTSEIPIHEKKEDVPIKKEHTDQLPVDSEKGFKTYLKKLFQKKVYVVDENETPLVPKRRKLSLTVGVLLIAILSISIFFGIKQKRKLEYKKTYEENLTKAKHAIDESVNLQGLNPARSRELFQEGRELVLGLSDVGIEDDELEHLREKIKEHEGNVLGEYRLEPELLVDLSLLSDGFNGKKISESNGNIYVLDIEGRKVASVNIASKRSEMIAGPLKVEDAKEIAGYSDNVFVANSEGIVEIVGEVEKVIDKDWDGEILISSFAGNMYLLEKQTSVIWRYPGDGKYFGERKNWLSEGAVPNLTRALEMSIDGNIWVLREGGEIKKFSMGNEENFRINETLFGDIEAQSFFTSEETESLYLLDKNNGQVLVFSKEGEYRARYISDEMKNAEKIAVYESEKRLVLMTGDKLLSIELKHLDQVQD